MRLLWVVFEETAEVEDRLIEQVRFCTVKPILHLDQVVQLLQSYRD